MKQLTTSNKNFLTFVVDENSTALSTWINSFPSGSSVTSLKALGLEGKPDQEIIDAIAKQGPSWILVTADNKKILEMPLQRQELRL